MSLSIQLSQQQARSLRMTPQLRQAIGLLHCNNLGLADFLERAVLANPYLSLQPLHRPPLPSGHQPAAARPGGAAGDPSQIDARPAAAAGLHEHARGQADLALRDPRQRRIAEHFIAALEPSGWLGRSAAEISVEAGCTAAEAEAVLAALQQQVEPAGLYARSLSECLRLQAQDRGVLDPGLDWLLDNLMTLGRGDIAGLAVASGQTPQAILGQLALIRTFDPKPGAGFDQQPAAVMPPDLIVARRDDGWAVDLNRSTLPTVTVRDAAAGSLADEDRQLLDAARGLERAVRRRNVTTLQIGAEIVRRQAAFLADGIMHLRPMTCGDVAGAIGLHDSTVSRVIAGMLIATPRETLPLRDLFSVALASRQSPEGASARSVREELRRQIAREDRARPLSDRQLAEILAAQGISVARRTIAKYRDLLRIPGAAERRLRARLPDR